MARKRKRPRYDPKGPRCFWCGKPCGKGNPARTDYPGTMAMTPVCGRDCPDRPDSSNVFDYTPPMWGRGKGT